VTRPDLHLDMAALALGALPPDEATAAEQHASTCESCSAELPGFRETAAALAAAVAETPPASLRRSVLAAIAVTPQEPPAAPVRQPRPWYRRPAALIAAAVAAVVIGGGVVAVTQFTGRDQQVAQTPEQCVATAADRTQVTPADGRGEVFYAPSCAAVTVDVSGLPALPADRTYQLWALSDQEQTAPRSLGLLPEAAQGQSQTVTQPTQAGEVAVAITAEPAGGSAAPTLPIVWTAELT
jgi:anti-sigma-K factor RskA